VPSLSAQISFRRTWPKVAVGSNSEQKQTARRRATNLIIQIRNNLYQISEKEMPKNGRRETGADQWGAGLLNKNYRKVELGLQYALFPVARLKCL